MTKKISIFHFLIAVMLFSLVIPAGVTEATPSDQGKLTIHKIAQEPGTTPGAPGDGSELPNDPEGTPVGNVVYTLTQTHAFDEGTGDWTETPDADSFTMTTDAGQGNSGIASKNLDLGRYTVQETSGPGHININPEKFTVEIPMTNADGTANNYDVHVYPKNEMVRGAVELTKLDGSTEKPMKGVQFELYDTADIKINDEDLFTDEEGKIQVDNLLYNHEGYYFKEVATIGGYVLDGLIVHFDITKSGSFDDNGGHVGHVEEVTAFNYKEPTVVKEVDKSAVNRGEVVTYTINLDLPADIADYTKFVVTDTLHANLEFESAGNTTGFSFAQDDQKLTWTGDPNDLSPGPVELTFKAKVSDTAEANVGIDNIATIDYTNKHDTDGDKDSDPVVVTPTAGSLKVLKQDGKTTDALSGAKFELHDMQNNLVAGPEMTGSNGMIDFGEVDFGDYQLVETKAPDGYRKLRSPIDVTIDAENSTQTITVDNYESGWELPKTGGIGTVLFTLIGLIFMGTAIYLYLRRRRNAAQ